MRIYLPSTLPALAAALDEGAFAPAPLPAYGVTPALRARFADGDEEELEYEAMRAAADASLRLLAADPAARRRRVVVAAEVPEAAVESAQDPDDPGAVTVTAPVPLKRVASAHVDEEAAAEDVAAAAAEDDPARADEHELLWYATQELRHLAE
ncbi:DUF6912 family protein [Marinitenerispora sediminis]|uniref:Uncharacterized protein n=1 Tax=Marinitenerispora sediminis TaxID=1931232 RepID=A0A368T3P0_9ACTN|nr:hypothetical protein [Marinitenerispora sediminis]RCV55717.1 hypothetical protein DEF28_05380 [Marinitenerispora sediminis]RCV56738.1 hypothetical protein DEF23_12185 [Marinitenerispora sediminis]RCV56767.1 hypothetical protein DEF24_16280 [Marinitenerispora sediminis]